MYLFPGKINRNLIFQHPFPLNLKLRALLQLIIQLYNDNLVIGEIFFFPGEIDNRLLKRSFGGGIYYTFFQSNPKAMLIYRNLKWPYLF